MNEYELSYQVPQSGGGMVKERIVAASEQNARNLLRAKFGGQQVQIFEGRMVAFGNRPDGRRDGNR